MHPLMVHFPIALLLIGPLLLLIGLLLGKFGRGVILSALIVMIFGTLTINLAAISGHAAEHAVKDAGQINSANHAMLNQHEHYADMARFSFSALTGLFLLTVIFLAIFGKRLKTWVRPVCYVVILLLCVPAILLLINAADMGALLVHKHGVHVRLTVDDPAVVKEKAKEYQTDSSKAPTSAPAAMEQNMDH